MSIESFMVQSVVIVRPGVTTNRYGDSVPDWNTATETNIKAWLV